MPVELHECGTVVRGDRADERIVAIAEGNRVRSLRLSSEGRIHTPDLAEIASRSVGSLVRVPKAFGPESGSPAIPEKGTPVPASRDLGP